MLGVGPIACKTSGLNRAERTERYICYLPAARSVLKKYFPEVSEAARGLRSGPRPKAEGRF